MRDTNLPLRKAYLAKLGTPAIVYDAVNVPVYFGELPPNTDPNNYIIVSNIENEDQGGKYKYDTSTTIRVAIHTFQEIAHGPTPADVIAGEVLGRIIPVDRSQLTLDDGSQIVSTELASDFLQDYEQTGARKYIDRVLTFRHYIFQR